MWAATAIINGENFSKEKQPPERSAWAVMDVLQSRAARYDLDPISRRAKTVAALLFAGPETDELKQLNRDGAFLDARTGEDWDLFFPGYYRSAWRGERAQPWGSPAPDLREPAEGEHFTKDWYYDPFAFHAMLGELGKLTGRQFEYDGRPLLVLASAQFSEESGKRSAAVAWQSAVWGHLVDTATERPLGLAELVERISRVEETSEEVEPDATWATNIGAPKEVRRAGRPLSRLMGALGALGLGVTGNLLTPVLNDVFRAP